MVDRAAWAALLAGAADAGVAQPLRICRLCVDGLGITGAGISLVTPNGNRGVVCSTDDTAARIEQLQFSLGEGPCVDAIRAGSPVLIADLTDPTGFVSGRWPGFLDAAATAGVQAVFAFPLQIGDIRLGAMDLYRISAGELSAQALAGALLAADAAAVSLLHLGSDGSDFLGDTGSGAAYQLQVHQATGMVMAQLGISIDEALLRLRARAFADDRPLPEVAQDVIDRRIRFAQEDA